MSGIKKLLNTALLLSGKKIILGYCGRSDTSKPTQRELEFLMGLHGGVFYIGMRRWIYGQAIYAAESPNTEQEIIRDRVQSYLHSAKSLFA